MSLFDEALDEYIQSTALPNNKAALKIWVENFQSFYAKKRGSKVKTPYKMSSEQAKAMANKRWGKTDRKNKKDS